MPPLERAHSSQVQSRIPTPDCLTNCIGACCPIGKKDGSQNKLSPLMITGLDLTTPIEALENSQFATVLAKRDVLLSLGEGDHFNVDLEGAMFTGKITNGVVKGFWLEISQPMVIEETSPATVAKDKSSVPFHTANLIARSDARVDVITEKKIQIGPSLPISNPSLRKTTLIPDNITILSHHTNESSKIEQYPKFQHPIDTTNKKDRSAKMEKIQKQQEVVSRRFASSEVIIFRSTEVPPSTSRGEPRQMVQAVAEESVPRKPEVQENAKQLPAPERAERPTFLMPQDHKDPVFTHRGKIISVQAQIPKEKIPTNLPHIEHLAHKKNSKHTQQVIEDIRKRTELAPSDQTYFAHSDQDVNHQRQKSTPDDITAETKRAALPDVTKAIRNAGTLAAENKKKKPHALFENNVQSLLSKMSEVLIISTGKSRPIEAFLKLFKTIIDSQKVHKKIISIFNDLPKPAYKKTDIPQDIHIRSIFSATDAALPIKPFEQDERVHKKTLAAPLIVKIDLLSVLKNSALKKSSPKKIEGPQEETPIELPQLVQKSEQVMDISQIKITMQELLSQSTDLQAPAHYVNEIEQDHVAIGQNQSSFVWYLLWLLFLSVI